MYRSEAKLRDIIDGSIQGIVVLRDFKPVFANAAYARMLGLGSPDDVVALGDLRRVMQPEFAVKAGEFWSEAMSGAIDGQVRRGAIRTVDGRTVWTDSIGRRLQWDGEPAFLVTVIDITERHLAEQELMKKTRQLQELNEQKDRLFSIVAHDLKGPFNSVIGFADALASNATTMPPAQVAEYARIVRDAAVGVHDLLDNLLTWAAFHLQDDALQVTEFCLGATIAAALEPVLPVAAQKGVVVLNGADAMQVAGDEALIRTVVRNLVSNGVKFCRAGGSVSLSAVAVPDPAGGPTVVCVTVRDDGVGMSAETVNGLFALGRPLSQAGTGGEKGTGLGLYLCRDIVVRHGGSIWAESTPGEGTAFHFTLPAARR